MSVLIQAMTSDNDEEVAECLERVKNVSLLGLINESVHVLHKRDTTRSWFAWGNSVFAQAILRVARVKPQLIFGEGAEPYRIEE